jgi:hypothetical protein
MSSHVRLAMSQWSVGESIECTWCKGHEKETYFLWLRSKDKNWKTSQTHSWGNIIFKLKNKRKNCYRSNYPSTPLNHSKCKSFKIDIFSLPLFEDKNYGVYSKYNKETMLHDVQKVEVFMLHKRCPGCKMFFTVAWRRMVFTKGHFKIAFLQDFPIYYCQVMAEVELYMLPWLLMILVFAGLPAMLLRELVLHN